MSEQSGSNPWAPEGWDDGADDGLHEPAVVSTPKPDVSPDSNPAFFQPTAPKPSTPVTDEAEDITVISPSSAPAAVTGDQTVLSSITLTPSRAGKPVALIARESIATGSYPTLEELTLEGRRRASNRAAVAPVMVPTPVSDSSLPETGNNYGVSDSNAQLFDMPGAVRETGWVLRGIGVDQRPLLACDYVLGRTPSSPTKSASDVLISVADTTGTVSRTHARLSFDGLSWTITDLNSTNGVSLVDSRGRENPLPAGGTGTVTGKFFVGDVELELVNAGE